MPRRDLTLAEKIAFLDQIRQQPPNTSQRRLVEVTALAKSTISRLMKQESELRREWSEQRQKGGGRRESTQKRKRKGKDPDVEEALNDWLSGAVERGVRLSGPMLKRKAEELSRKLGHDGFKATDGWLSRWKSRHDVKFKKDRGRVVDGNDDDDERDGQWKSKLPKLEMPDATYDNDDDDVNNDDDDDGDSNYKPVEPSDSKKISDDATVSSCSNVPGTDGTTSEDRGSDRDAPGPSTTPARVTAQDARRCIETLCRYFAQEGIEGHPLPHPPLDARADFVRTRPSDGMRQVTLDKFFRR